MSKHLVRSLCVLSGFALAPLAAAQQPPNNVTVSPQQDPGVYSAGSR